MQGRTFKERCRAANEQADIVYLALTLGLDANTHTHPPTAHCPFHGDEGRKNLTFFQQPGSRGAALPRAHCFTCGVTATALDLVMKQQDMEIKEALDWLERFLGIQGGSTPLPSPRIIRPTTPKPAQPVKNKRAALNQAIRRLWDEEKSNGDGHNIRGGTALTYLHQRGLSNDTIREYQLGYWGADESRWSGRFVVPYLESLEPDSEVWTMLGGRVRSAVNVDGDAGMEGAGPAADLASRLASDDAGGRRDIRPDERHSPKYLYTSAAHREPYLWRIAMDRAESDGTLIICEGELDGLSILSAFGGVAPVAALGGVGAISTVANEPRLAGLDILYVADREASGNPDKLATLERVVAQNIWKLRQLNANVRLLYPPELNEGGKTDVNDLLVAYGPEFVEDWLLDEIAQFGQDSERSLM